MSATTIGALRREIAAMLAATSTTAALDARLLVAHGLGLTSDAVLAGETEAVTVAHAAKVRQLAERRRAGEPVARILGEWEFYGLPFFLSPETLVPRPDTETVVDAVLADRKHDDAIAVLDLGTGSGAILIALLHELPHATGVGIDKAKGAVATAKRNAERNGVAGRATFHVGDWGQGVTQRFDVVVSNPPYIERNEIAALAVEVREHDPHLALDGGEDGLDAVRAIIADLDRLLTENGAAYIEVGEGQAPRAAELAKQAGFGCSFRRDLSGVPRVVIARPAKTAENPVG